jgi:hypothetical protein
MQHLNSPNLHLAAPKYLLFSQIAGVSILPGAPDNVANLQRVAILNEPQNFPPSM